MLPCDSRRTQLVETARPNPPRVPPYGKKLAFGSENEVPGPLWPLLREFFPTLRRLNAARDDRQRLCAEPSKNVFLRDTDKSPK